VGEVRNLYNVFVRVPEMEDRFECPDVDERPILKCVSKKFRWRASIGFDWLGIPGRVL
jgi:hypothetical protein